MSTTFSFVCDDCKEKCWAGQSDYLYNRKTVAAFLHIHSNHRLRFIADGWDEEVDEEYIEYPEN